MTYYSSFDSDKTYKPNGDVIACHKCGGYKVVNHVGRMSRSRRKLLVYGLIAGTILLFIYNLRSCSRPEAQNVFMVPKEKFITDKDMKVYTYDRDMPLIFIGGVPRSGTTLMRAMLDAHPDVRCGQETRVVPRILQMRNHWYKSSKETLRLKEAGVSEEVVNSAVAAFILEVIARHGVPAPRLCNKDPLALKSMDYLKVLFPNAKYIFMVRDGRATVHSIISRKVTITGFDLTSYRQCLEKWDDAISIMYKNCQKVGPTHCLMVYYEELVLRPRDTLTHILKFLNIPWNETVLHHNEMINKPGGIALSMVERSSDQVVKPLYQEALTKWVGQIPDDVVAEMDSIAPMLSVLGYDPMANPPVYAIPENEQQNSSSNVDIIEKESTER
ncbi:protein-tyrosine sulfotransferase-like isoform X2 [Daktulosphaira vitifoliae]|uniref:protein-tyrosine sulfotransferase-like isoform X2 n=1 Tax=Daktulosphaira vitifoliae TaxID=58002 RepID=UPI0021AA9FA4|nr:protein-tyrosine sulfotransferase-like isoform X2 [Daktulosphaira vitifoliae]